MSSLTFFFFFSSRRRHTRWPRDWSSDVCSSDLQFGPGSEESPAAIARVLADEGAELRHPEVIELDARWREAKIESHTARFKGLEDLLTGKPLRLKKAEALIKRLEKLRN